MSTPSITLVPAFSHQIVALRRGATHIGSWSVPADDLDPPEVLDILAALYHDLAVNPGWGSWFIIRAGTIVGNCSLTEPPENASCFIGYSINPGSQGRGYATAAVTSMLVLLRAHDISVVRAETSATNRASQAVLAKCDFVRTAERFDPEDGDLVTWQRAL